MIRIMDVLLTSLHDGFNNGFIKQQTWYENVFDVIGNIIFYFCKAIDVTINFFGHLF
jgi:hypothetical protein